MGLAQQVAELKARLDLPAKSPENSSVPPSQRRKPSVPRNRKGRRRKSRPGVARALDPNPTRMHEVRAACCPHCRGDLAAAAQAPCESYDHIEILRGLIEEVLKRGVVLVEALRLLDLAATVEPLRRHLQRPAATTRAG